MKQRREWFRPVLFKTILILVLVYNTGFITALFRDFPSFTEDSEYSREEIAQKIRLTNDLVEGKIRVAKDRIAAGGDYSPYDYFHDLREIEDFFSATGFSTHLALGPLQAMMNDSITRRQYTFDDVVAAREKFKFDRDNTISHRLEFFEMVEEKGWPGVLAWIFGIYLANLLPIALFYLVWMVEQNREEKKNFCFPNPFHFLWVVLAHPYFFTRIFVKWLTKNGREWYVEAEYRRTKAKLFVFLSEREQKKIKDFAQKGLPIAIWRELLRLRGFRPVHSLAMVLCVMMVIAILPRPSDAKAKAVKDYHPLSFGWQKTVNHLPRMALDGDICQGHLGGCDQDAAALPEICGYRYYPERGEYYPTPQAFCFQEARLKIMRVPIQTAIQLIVGAVLFLAQN